MKKKLYELTKEKITIKEFLVVRLAKMEDANVDYEVIFRMKDEIAALDSARMLHRIRALERIKEFEVKAGDLGGWVEDESSIINNGVGWIEYDAAVYGGAMLHGAYICDNALISNGAVITNSIVGENAWVTGKTIVRTDSLILGNVFADEKAEIYKDVNVSGNVQIIGARVSGYVIISGNMRIGKKDRISG